MDSPLLRISDPTSPLNHRSECTSSVKKPNPINRMESPLARTNEIQSRIEDLADYGPDGWRVDADLTDAEKRMLESRLEELEKNPENDCLCGNTPAPANRSSGRHYRGCQELLSVRIIFEEEEEKVGGIQTSGLKPGGNQQREEITTEDLRPKNKDDALILPRSGQKSFDTLSNHFWGVIEPEHRTQMAKSLSSERLFEQGLVGHSVPRQEIQERTTTMKSLAN